MSTSPIELYREKREAGQLCPDPTQELAAEKLQSLFMALRGYEPDTGPRGWRERLGLNRRKQQAPQGLYLYGGVGTGKSTMMDIFYDMVPVAKKRRVHFHAFMSEVQKRLHELRKTEEDEDILIKLADDLFGEVWLLCFDEFHVVNIADAMILARLFTALFDKGIVVVATSNWPPNRLYEGGLQRQNFLPFIDLLLEKLDVLQLDGGIDYRLNRVRAHPVYFCPLNADSRRAVNTVFDKFAGDHRIKHVELQILGHPLQIQKAAGSVAQFSFMDICGHALGANDYLVLAQKYEFIIVTDIPVLASGQRNEARRFMLLVDALYEHRCKLVISAACLPDELYPVGDGAFEFERTVSRLHEMASAEYMALPHIM